MKLAIIGSGPLAIFCANHFDQLGAEVVLFQKEALGGNARFLLDHFPQMEISFDESKKSLKNLWEENLVPLIQVLEERNLTKAGEVLRVHKRFLHIEESISSRSRLHDLFRVIYSVNPKEAILKQLDENPEMFKQLGEQVISSLHMPVESFMDFDIVIEARGRGRAAIGMGPSESRALNELNLKETSPIFYEKEIFTKFSLEDKNHLIVVGHEDSAAMALLKCKEWLFSSPSRTLSWITHSQKERPFENEWLNQEVDKLFRDSEEQFNGAKIDFEKKIHEWRDLEDYVKAKIPMPIEPEAKLRTYQGYDVTSVDRLLDRPGVFVTIESPDFRDYAPLNDLKTLPADAILVCCGVEDCQKFSHGIQSEEPGFYRLYANDLDEGLLEIKKIEKKILSFFSRAE
ncbi:MAG: hypothetical protein ACXVLQ_00995 [Bacteriovorax sp.]